MCASHLTLPPPPKLCVCACCAAGVFPSWTAQFHANYDISLHQAVTNIFPVWSMKNNKTLTLYLCIMQQHDEKALNVTFERWQKHWIKWYGNTEEELKRSLLSVFSSENWWKLIIYTDLIVQATLGHYCQNGMMPILTCSTCFRLYFGMQQLISIIEHHDEIAGFWSLEGWIV